MKPTQSAPLGTTASGGARNWQTSAKGSKYHSEHDRIFGPRKAKPGLTVVVYRDGQRPKEFTNAFDLSPSQCGIRMKVTAIV